MLRYKNSLLERILLEKGIDVQAELRAKTGSPNLGPTHMPQNMVQPPPISRSLMRHHHSRRSNSSIAPKVESGVPLAPLPAPLISPHIHSTRPSPKNQPTPPSIATSPTGTATGSHGSQYAPSPATSGSDLMNGQGQVRHRMKAPPIPPPSNMSNPLARHMQMAGPPQHPQHQQQQQRPSRPSVGAPAPFYAAQAYQNHIEQLGKLTPFFYPLLMPPLIELCRPRFINWCRTGVRCRSRHDGRPRRPARHTQRTWTVSGCTIRRRTTANVAAFAGHDHATKRARTCWAAWTHDLHGRCSASAPTTPTAAASTARPTATAAPTTAARELSVNDAALGS